ncbi:uncharacterized protein MYCGRDRAFT_51429 [Zymoseptoria tritici IPO323]|uniref:Phosphoribosylaminoimidazole-succinocarboxamide synthase n=1 Tax=Zymoseptoria tritici (strain CBS 115943 / IPO323) TaxID=336722 RepID=F9XPU9_ZYMTI|nr:uncharacterized protein MYCGRDRAFT_51429 [Zymoseptoria tritici IPO323]EGP82767.1 hypothetical protein MYCGRDRAFT_51429 [Zymoseptoria tritici IPO323]
MVSTSIPRINILVDIELSLLPKSSPRRQQARLLTLIPPTVSNPSIIHSRPSQQSFAASDDYYSLSGSSTNSNESAAVHAASQHTITRFQTPPSRYRTPQQSRDYLPQRSRDNLLEQQHATVEEEEVRKTPMRGEGKRRSSVSELEGASGVAVGGKIQEPAPSQQRDAPTPGVDDTPYIQFALDQLTRDEEVRGSRLYPGTGVGGHGSYPAGAWPLPATHRYESVPQEEKKSSFEQVPQRNPQRLGTALHPQSSDEAQSRGQNVFMAVPDSQYSKLDFLPGILRPIQLGAYLALVVIFLACLIFTAVWSRANTTLTDYGRFGDARYFVFRYLPTLLGMILLMWLFQIEIALYRIAPFIAMTSPFPRNRLAGAQLPLVPQGFVLPYFKHFSAGQPVIGAFILISWLQLFTIPLLASSFNSYQQNGVWRWLAVQPVIWVAVSLYILLVVALVMLLFWLSRTATGLKWDPRSLADLIVLLERSNAFDGESEDVAKLGQWRTSHRPNEIFHGYGVEDKPARSYGVQDGRITEKRYSDPEMDIEAGRIRTSKEAILARNSDSNLGSQHSRGGALPWFLKPFFALLWPIIAIVLLIAFLVISYLPSTTVANGFDPRVSSFVSRQGYNNTNFLYSFLPASLAMLCLLFWLSIDLAHRRLQPFASLAGYHVDHLGDSAERTLLPSYPADLPVQATLTSLINTHWRPALTSFTTLLAATLPILAGGVFWALFYPSTQSIRVTAHMPAYYALSVFLALYAFAYIAIYPPGSLRNAHLPRDVNTFAGVRDLVAQSRLLDDLAFRSPRSKVDLVTRLLSDTPEGWEGLKGMRFGFGKWTGRDGREWVGVDRER